jgi:hypothetical protein
MLFIPCSGGRGEEVSAVYAKPARDCGNALETYLSDERSIESWESLLFSILKAETHDKNEEAISELAQWIEENHDDAPLGVTPLKKRPKLEIRSPALDAGYELTLMDLEEDLGTSPDLVLANLRLEWKKAAGNFAIEGLRKQRNLSWPALTDTCPE